MEAPVPATGAYDTRGDWSRLPQATGQCWGWCRSLAVTQGRCQAGEEEGAAAGSRGGDLAQVCPDSSLKDVRLQSPTVTQRHVMNLLLPPVARDFLQAPQHIAFRDPADDYRSPSPLSECTCLPKALAPGSLSPPEQCRVR